MPAYHLECKECGERSRRIVPRDQLDKLTCTKCGGKLARNLQPPTTQVMETLDNGIMPRRIERPADAERLYKERSKKGGR